MTLLSATSKLFASFAQRLNIRLQFRCAHVPSENRIVERCHRSIKVIAARKGCSVEEAVYLHNLRPLDDVEPATAPSNLLYWYTVRIHGGPVYVYHRRTDSKGDVPRRR